MKLIRYLLRMFAPMSYDFNGSGWMLTGTLGADLAAPCSLVAWIKCPNASWESTSKDWIVMISNSDASDAFTMSKTQASAERVTCSARDGGSEANAHEGHPDNTYNDTWVMVANVFTTDSLRDVYVEDAANTGQATGSRSPVDCDLIRIGASISGFSNLHGLIAEVAIFDEILTTDMIDDLQTGAEAGIPPNEVRPDDCVGYWSLDTDQSTHADESGNGGPTLTVDLAEFSSDHPTITPTAAPIVIMVPTGPEF